MIAFQLDQCLDSKRFVRDCNAEGLCQIHRLPPSLRGKEDPELLSVVMPGNYPLVTFDRALPHNHTQFIPESNSGIVVLINYPSLQTMTISIGQKVLRQFKSAFPDWYRLTWRNSIVEVTSIGVTVWHVAGGKLIRDTYQARAADGWQSRLAVILKANAQGGSVALP